MEFISIFDTQINNTKFNTSPDPSESFPYKIFNIGNSMPINLMDYIQEIENQIGKKAK